MVRVVNLEHQVHAELSLRIRDISWPSWAVVFGPSGSGKTTLIRVLAGLAGGGADFQFWVNGEDLAALPVPNRRLGVVFQGSDLFPHMTARENLEFAARCRGAGWLRRQDDVADGTARLGIQHLMDRPVSRLSGGERQRVALLRACLGEPKALLLDEPFSHLDAANRECAREYLREFTSRRGVPVLLVSHDPADRHATDAKVFLMDCGQILSHEKGED